MTNASKVLPLELCPTIDPSARDHEFSRRELHHHLIGESSPRADISLAGCGPSLSYEMFEHSGETAFYDFSV